MSERWVTAVPSRVRAFSVTGAVAWFTSSDIASQGRSSDLVALDRSSGAELKAIHFDDNMYGTAAFGAGRVVLNQGGSLGEPSARLRVFGLAPPLPVIDTVAVSAARTTVAYSQTIEASGGAGTRARRRSRA